MEDAVVIWLMLSIAAEVLTTVWLRTWLGRRTQLSRARVGIPGYLEREYAAWCRRSNVDARRVIAVRIALMVNLLIAAGIGIPVLIRS